VSNTQILIKKITPNIGIMKITSQSGQLDSNQKNIFRTKHDGISSKLIAKK
jgi:hypothetical protein